MRVFWSADIFASVSPVEKVKNLFCENFLEIFIGLKNDAQPCPICRKPIAKVVRFYRYHENRI